MVETIYANRRDPFPPFIIALRQKIIDSWVLEELVGFKHITCTLISYTNNEVIMQYLDYLIKYFKARLEKL